MNTRHNIWPEPFWNGDINEVEILGLQIFREKTEIYNCTCNIWNSFKVEKMVIDEWLISDKNASTTNVSASSEIADVVLNRNDDNARNNSKGDNE